MNASTPVLLLRRLLMFQSNTTLGCFICTTTKYQFIYQHYHREAKLHSAALPASVNTRLNLYATARTEIMTPRPD